MTKEEEFKKQMIMIEWHEKFLSDHVIEITHYTSPKGFEGIIESGTLWATRFDFLNDTTERKDAKDLYDKVVNELSQQDHFYDKFKHIEPCGEYGWTFNKNHLTSYKAIKNPEVFVISFSKNPDSKSLWNYYVKNDKKEGYALTFQKKDFDFYDHEPGYDIKCFDLLYNEEKKRMIIKKVLQQIKDIYVEDEECLKFARASIGRLLFDWQDPFKNHHFKDEEEHRILIVQDKENPKYIVHNNEREFDKPYIEFPFGEFLKLVTVTRAPLYNDTETQERVEKLLTSKGYKNVVIKNSEVPLRY